MTSVDLPAMDVAGRSVRLRDALDSSGCDALLVTHLTNIRYLTGFTGSAALLVVDAHGLLFVTDGRYDEQAHDELSRAGVTAVVEIGRTTEVQREHVAKRLATTARVGLESEHVSWADQRRYAATRFPAATLVPVAGSVEALRLVKDAGEVARIEAACGIADAALAAVRPLLDERPTEAGFALALDGEIRARGADDISFETIVASGPNGSRPHHTPSNRAIEQGDLVVIDFGALVDGYHSDMTRTVPVGGLEALDDTQRRMMAVVTEAQAAGVAAVRAGGSAQAVDGACRAVIDAAGWGEAFVHGTGHGVGLDIHEDPRVSWAVDATLADGQVVTVEPGVYLPGHGGVRVEDTVVVTSTGCRPLTRAPKS
jgi:Xaa-Pro aminopeptidase